MVPLIVQAVAASDTATVQGLNQLIGESAHHVAVVASLWSLLTVVRGSVKYLSMLKDGCLGIVGQVGMATYVLLGSLSRSRIEKFHHIRHVHVLYFLRFIALLAFLAPSLGLFSSLSHWQLGRLDASKDTGRGVMQFSFLSPLVYNVKTNAYGDKELEYFADKWEKTPSYTDYTLLAFGHYSALLLGLIALHFVLVAAIKMRVSVRFQLEGGAWTEKVVSVLDWLEIEIGQKYNNCCSTFRYSTFSATLSSRCPTVTGTT